MNFLQAKKYCQRRVVKQSKFTYSPLEKALEKQRKKIEDQGEKQIKTIKDQVEKQIKTLKNSIENNF